MPSSITAGGGGSGRYRSLVSEERVTSPGSINMARQELQPAVSAPKDRGLRAIDGLLTGLHEPRASHLALLEALAGREHLRKAYAEALNERYLWHEFGDLHLILP